MEECVLGFVASAVNSIIKYLFYRGVHQCKRNIKLRRRSVKLKNLFLFISNEIPLVEGIFFEIYIHQGISSNLIEFE